MAKKTADVFPIPYGERWIWPTTMSKLQWGHRGWDWMHGLAIKYPQDPSRADGIVAFRKIWNFVQGLPCQECRNHAIAFVIAQPPDLANTYALQRWVWMFHNSVNFRLKKRMIPYEEYQ